MPIPPPIRFADELIERNAVNDNIHLGALTTITLWHDYLCPWCYVVLFQAKRLKEEYGVTLDWRGAELMPLSIPYTPRPQTPPDPNASVAPPSRFDLFALAEGVIMPSTRPSFTRTHAALLATEYVTIELGVDKGEAFIEAVYRAYWEKQQDIADHAVLTQIAESIGIDAAPLLESVAAERYNEKILAFDDDAYAAGVRHVPTFVFGAEERLAEAPYSDLAHATERFQIRLERWKGK